MSSKIRIGQIGCGYWGPNLIRNFYQLPDCVVNIVCDSKEKRLDYVQRRYPGIKITQNYKELLNDSKLDAIIIATEVASHYKLSKEALAARKHVLVEKPLAVTTDQCRELIELARKQKVILMVGHTFEYNAAVNKVKKLIMGGTLGVIYYIYSQRLNLGIVRQDVNVVWNLAPHDISIILYWLEQEPISVSAKGWSYLQNGLEDVVYINFEFKNDISAHIHVSWLDPNKVRKMTIVGSQKMVVYDDVSMEAKVQIYDKGITKNDLSQSLSEYDTFDKFQLIQRAGDLLIPKVDFIEPLLTECSHFIECIKNGKTPLTDGDNGLRVVRVLEAAQKSLKNAGETIEIS